MPLQNLVDTGLGFWRARHCEQSFFKTNRGMAPKGSRRGCDTAWAETRGGGSSFTFTCKGCRNVEFLVRELAELREMLVGMKRTVTGQGLEEKGGVTGDRDVGLEEQEKAEGCLAPLSHTTAWQKKTGMERRMWATFRQKIETPI